jgi:alanyl-tRNA synthetase
MTRRLYYLDSYLRQFQANVLKLSQTDTGFEIVLDQTAFYPTSGGQPHDLGCIQGRPILDVFENEKAEIIHRAEKPVESGELECSIDWLRRFDHMQQHTGQHILSQAFLRTCQLNTVGFHMGASYSTIDLESGNIGKDQLRQAEDLANAIVYESRPVTVRLVSPQEVPNLNLRKESQRQGPLRIVEVEDFDVSACGGTHVRMTGEIGGILIRKVERVKRQTRVEFVCGRRALESHRADLRSLDTIARKFSVGLDEAAQRVEKQIEENRQLRKALQERRETLVELLARDFYAKAQEHQGFKTVKQLFEDEEFDFVKSLAQSIVSQGRCVALLGNKSSQAELVLAQSESMRWDLRELLSECCKLIEGKGGGTANLVQGGGKNPQQLQAALDLAESRILSASQ